MLPNSTSPHPLPPPPHTHAQTHTIEQYHSVSSWKTLDVPELDLFENWSSESSSDPSTLTTKTEKSVHNYYIYSAFDNNSIWSPNKSR